MKRTIDLVIAGFALAILSPFLILIVIAIYVDSGRPIFFRQRRVGKHFQAFSLVKFRSMRARSLGPKVTIKGDMRITRVGKLLRASKLDELPQFWNVLRGDMSLVGPRPEVPEYVEMFKNRFRSILVLRPGITDLASIRFRNEESILAASPDPLETYTNTILPAKLDLAEEYLRDHSLTGDFTILFRTAFVTLRGR